MIFRRALPWMGIVATVLMVVCGFGFWYLSAQRLRLDEENRRELAHAGHDLENILSDLSSSAAKFFEKSSKRDLKSVLEFARRNPYVDYEGTASELGSVRKITPLVIGRVCPGLENPSKLSLSTQKDGAIGLALDTERILDDVAISDAIEYLFIADDTGRVTFARQYGEASRHQDGLGWLDHQSREHADRNHTTIRLEHLSGLIGTDGKPVDPKQLSRASGTYSVQLGANGYQMFSYPVTMPGVSKCEGKTNTWIVGGLVDPKRMWREAATLLPRWTLVLLLVLVLGLAAKPFVKLCFLSPTERFHFADGCMLLPSATILLMLVTVLLLHQGTHYRINSLAERGLESLAGEVETRLTGEFGTMRDQLVAFDDYFAEQAPNLRCQPDAKGFEETDVSDLLTSTPPSLAIRPQLYHDLWSVAWLDNNGNQIFKEDVHPLVTSRQNLKTRPYFTEPLYRKEHLWSLNPPPKLKVPPRTRGESGAAEEHPFFVQSLRSSITGELTTALSINSELKDVCGSKGNFIAVLTTAPLAVERPLLPVGYDFAVVAADGQVLYHSDRRRTLKEDFFAEVSDAEALHAAIQAGAKLPMTTTYGRSPVDMYMQSFEKLQGTHWFVVTMRDRRWVEALSTEALVRTAVWCVISWLATLGAAIVILWKGRSTLRYFWPDPRQITLYRTLAFAYALLLAAGMLFATYWARPGNAGLLWFSLTYPFLLGTTTLIVYGIWRHAAREPRTPERSGSRWAAWYLAALAGLWAAGAVVPAAGLFRHSWHLELDKLNHFELDREQQRALDWTAADQEFYRKQEIRVSDKDFFTDREARRGFFGAEYSDALTSQPSAFDQGLDLLLPFYAEQVEALRYQQPTALRAIARTKTDSVSDQRAGVAFSPISVAGFALVGVLAGWWLRFNVRNLFWTHLDLRADPPNRLIEKNRLALLLAPSERDKRALQELLKRPKAAAASVSGEGGSIGSMDAKNMELVDFEEATRSEENRRTTLEWLEQAVEQSDRRVVILATSDPLQLLSGQKPVVEWPVSERERWLSLLQSFVKGTVPIAVSRPKGSDAYFDSLWQHCSKSEQLTLLQVAQEGFANPNCATSVEQLLNKGILLLAPNLRLMDEDFERFVVGQASSVEIEQWERPRGGLGWRGARPIFLAFLVIGLVLVVGTGESWLQGATAMATALAGGLEAFWKLLGAVQRPASAAGGVG